jgi:hypothetical protein
MSHRCVFLPHPTSRGHDVWAEAGCEPSLAEVLDDPLVHLVMRRDGVELLQLRQIIAQAQAQLGQGRCRGFAA